MFSGELPSAENESENPNKLPAVDVVTVMVSKDCVPGYANKPRASVWTQDIAPGPNVGLSC